MENSPETEEIDQKIAKLVQNFVRNHIIMMTFDEMGIYHPFVIRRNDAEEVGLMVNGQILDTVDKEMLEDLGQIVIDPSLN